MSLTKFPNGISSFGIPVMGAGDLTTTGNIWFVSSGSGSDGNTGTDKDHPFATLDYAIGKCTASQGDIIILMPGHAETTTAIAADVAGISIIGLGIARTRPTITASTAASDLINVTAANVKIQNIRLVGAASGCTALVDLVGAADFQLIGCSIEHGAAPTSAITVAATSPRFNIIGCNFLGSANGPAVAIDIEATGDDDFIVQNCIFNYGRYGLDTAGIRADADAADGGTIDNCIFIGMDAAAVDFNSSDTANIAGVISNCMIGMGASTANIDTAVDPGGYGLFNVFTTDIVTERGGWTPVTSPA